MNNELNNTNLTENGEAMTYEKALAELETIARKMESGGYDIDQLADQLKRAQGLIKLCRDKLTKTDAEIKKILDAEE